MSVKLIVDSTSDLLPELKQRVEVVPLTVRFGDEEYEDGVTIDHRTFYEKMAKSKVLPQTSQVTPAAFAKVFDRALANGDELVVITLSSKFSGTWQSARIAAGDRKDIYIVDSESASVGEGILVEYALSLADRGLRAAEIASILEEKKKDIMIIALLDTLEYLHRGGRLSRTAAIAGTLMNIKPVLSVAHGAITVLGKARGLRQGSNLLDQQIEKCGGVDFSMPVMLGYTGVSDELLNAYADDSKRIWAGAVEKLRCAPIGSVIGTHAGPGTIVAAFFMKDAK